MFKDAKDFDQRLRQLGLRVSEIESEVAEAKQEIDALKRMKRYDLGSPPDALDSLVDILEDNDD
jgi:hypothetical protein